MMARLAMVVAIGGWRAARYPDNADYILRNNALSWPACRPATASPATPRGSGARGLRFSIGSQP